MEEVRLEWLIKVSWEVDKVMYHLERESRDWKEILESEITRKCFLRPEVREFSLF